MTLTPWEIALDELQIWCRSHGLQLFFSRSEPTGTYWNLSREIVVNSRYGLETKCYIILHECGHYLCSIDYSGGRKTHRPSSPLLTTADPKAARDSQVLNDLREEFEAWDRGLKLGRRLGILPHTGTPKRWVQLKNKCLKSYIHHTAQKLEEP